MSRLDPSKPKLVPKMIRLDPDDWERLERYAVLEQSRASVVIRAIITEFLNSVDEYENPPADSSP